MISCKNCGADLRFDAGKQKLICDFCDSEFEVLNKINTNIKSESRLMDAIVYTCPQCGGELYTTEDTAATFCSYCGSSVLLERRMAAVAMPDFIIPFKVTKEQAEQAYRKKLARSLFAPSSLKDAEIEKLRGIYMPYWEYYVKDSSYVSFEASGPTVRHGDYLCTEKFNVSFELFAESDGLEYDASSKLPDDLSSACAPYYFQESKLYNPDYMSGFYADVGDMPAKAYTPDALDVVAEVGAEEVLSHCSFGNVLVSADEIKKHIVFNNIEPGLAMYPLWFASVRSRDGKHINYAAINGQSGKVAADIPVDRKKLLLWTAVFAVPFFIVLYFLFTPTPQATAIVTGIISVAASIAGLSRINKITGTKKKSSGQGVTVNILGKDYKFNRSKESPAPAPILPEDEEALKRTKSGIKWRLVVCIVLAALLLLFNPSQDFIFYGGVVVMGVLCCWTFWSVFDIYNRLISRPLPQLDARGGDGK